MALQKCFSQFWWFLEIFTPVWKILKYNKQKHWSTCLDPNSPWYFQIQNMRFRFWLPDPSLILSTTHDNDWVDSIQFNSKHNKMWNRVAWKQILLHHQRPASKQLRPSAVSWFEVTTPPHTPLCNDDLNKLNEPDAKFGRFSAFVPSENIYLHKSTIDIESSFCI